MIVQCAWCKKIVSEKAPLSDKSVTHTICAKCAEVHWGIKPKEVKSMENPKHLKKITILKDTSTGEYRVPGPAGTEAQAYYTDDRNDAIGTAQHMWKGHDISITFKHIPDFDRFLENPKKQSYRVWFKNKETGKMSETIIKATTVDEAKGKFYSLTEHLRKDKSKLYPFSIVEIEKYKKNPKRLSKVGKKMSKNPGAKWHEKQVEHYDKQFLATPKDDNYSLGWNLGAKSAHTVSARMSEKLGINPKQSFYDTIEYTAVEFYMNGYGIDDIKTILQQDFRIDNKTAEYYAKRAGQIVRGREKYVTPKIARLLQTIKR